MKLENLPIKPYNLKFKAGLFTYKGILSKFRIKCKSEDITIKQVVVSWGGFRHPLTVCILIVGSCIIPESDIIAIRKQYNKQNKKKRKNKQGILKPTDN